MTQPQPATKAQLYPEILYSGKLGCGPNCGNWPAKTGDECTFCPERNNEHPVSKTLWPDGETTPLPLEPSLKLRGYSLTGFWWGGDVLGASQLALALLYDATGDPDKAGQFYYDFKIQVVSEFDREWVIFRSTILDWLELMEARDIRERQGKN